MARGPRKPQPAKTIAEQLPPPPEDGEEAAPARTATIKLSNNYRPVGAFEIVGYWQDKVEVKDASGQMVEISPAMFIAGEAKPPPQAGVGASTKLWAGTVIKLDIEEAKAVRNAGIGTVELD